MRDTGRTTNLLKSAPHGAVFVWCNGDLRYPTRLAWGPDGRLYVSDPKIGSVFIYDPNLSVVGELKSLGRPLGIAVDASGNIYAGSNDHDSVEVYDFNGVKIATWGQGKIKMPVALFEIELEEIFEFLEEQA